MPRTPQTKEQWEKVVTNFNCKGEVWIFMTTEVSLSLPLKALGEVWHTGWDIPTGWAIDNANQCWADNAHGKSLYPISADNLLSTAELYGDKVKISATLGLNKPQPEWVKSALAAGWTPPKDFKP